MRALKSDSKSCSGDALSIRLVSTLVWGSLSHVNLFMNTAIAVSLYELCGERETSDFCNESQSL